MIIRTIWLLVLAAFTCVSAQAQQTPLNIVVSVAPQKYLLQKITGNNANIRVLIAPGQNPATWELSPRKMAEMASTDILFSIGVPFEKIWLPRLQNNFPQLLIVDSRSGIKMLSLPNHSHQTATGATTATGLANVHAAIDPHIWLDPVRDMQLAQNMTKTLCLLDPAHCQDYRRGLDTLLHELKQLHQQITALLQPYAERQFMVFHPAWGYFAQRYQLHQLAIELSGKEPRGAKLVQIAEAARLNHISCIFVQQQFSQKAATTIAAQIGAKVIPLDPLAEDLSHTLLTTAEQLKHALESPCQPSSH